MVIAYRTDRPGGTYLRMATLPQFDAAGWGSVQIRLNTGSELPEVPGLSDVADQERTTRITVLDFCSQYLPLPYAPRSFDAEGDWRYDANSLIVVNGGDDQARALRRPELHRARASTSAPNAATLPRRVAGTRRDD